jgi:diguanylate cyclase (GGDEF)-like protein
MLAGVHRRRREGLVRVKFWGTRGSIATPGPATARYGGNTSCVEVRSDGGTLMVFDCGTGARALGDHLVRSATGPLRVHLFIGHTHWDHIQGFPFFVPAFLPGTELNIYAPAGFQRSLEEAMAGLMEYSYFPVKLRDLRSRLHFTELEEGFLRVGDVLVETHYLNHTAPTVAYRLSSGGATVAYVTDHEPFWPPDGRSFAHPGDVSHVAFLKSADLVIHDAQYTEAEYREHTGWGHSTAQYAVDVALAAGVRRLALFHHDPAHDDVMLEAFEQAARQRAGRHLDVFAAAEGREIDVRGVGGEAPVPAVSARRSRPIAGGRVLLVSADQAEAAVIEELLAGDDLSVFTVPDAQEALARVPKLAPDVAIVDARIPERDGLVASLLQRIGERHVPTILLTPAPATPGPLTAHGAAFDYLASPFSPPMLHARVRAWLARAIAGGGPERLTVAGAAQDTGAAPGPAQPAMLASFPLFQVLSRAELEQVVQGAREHTYPAGHAIIDEGETDHRVFVVLAGRVRVVEAMPEVLAEAVLGGLGEGDIFGELSAITGRPRSATVLALERTRCLALDHRRFLAAVESSPAFALALLRTLGRRLQDTDRRLARYAPDTLTGLASRRAFLEQYRGLAAGARRRKSGVVLLLFDVVQLRAVNDRFGYSTGDAALRVVADALLEATRATDLVARYGADEFAVLLLDAGLREVEAILPRVAERLRELSARRGLPAPVQCGVGIAFREVAPETAEELVREADADLGRRRRVPA